MNRLFLDEKQVNLLLASEAIYRQEFNAFRRFLETSSRVLQFDIKRRPELKEVPAYIDSLLMESQREWEPYRKKPYTDLGNEFEKINSTCALCHYRPLRHEYAIQNKYNKRVLIIGSECIQQFGRHLSRQLPTTTSERTRSSRLLEVEQVFPGIRKLIDNGHRYIHKTPVAIPQEIKKEWTDNFIKLRLSYDDYVASRVDDMDELQQRYVAQSNLKNEITQYITEKEKDPNHVKGELLQWLRSRQNNELLQMVEEDGGVITRRTIHMITETNFVKNTVIQLNDKLKNRKGLSLIKLNPKTNKVTIQINNQQRYLQGTLHFKELAIMLGGLLYEKHYNLNYNSLLKAMKLTDESFRKVVKFLINIFKIKEKVLSIKNYYKEDREIVFYENDIWYVFKTDDLEKFMKNIYFQKKLNFPQFNRQFYNLARHKYNREEIKDYYYFKSTAKAEDYVEQF